jgi:hypothetical protein
MKISVTSEDIAAGKRGSCVDCPVVLAVERASGGAVIAGRTWITAAFDGRPGRRWRTPDIVAEFMLLFDQGRPVVPFTFDLP